jgi:hypothetical protein
VIASTDFSVLIDGTLFYHQYRTEPASTGGAPLSEPGDSGAAVLDSRGYAVGLIIAGDGVRMSIVNPIGQIFAALNLKMPS